MSDLAARLAERLKCDFLVLDGFDDRDNNAPVYTEFENLKEYILAEIEEFYKNEVTH